MKAILTFVKRCLLLGILFFGLLGFQGKADATTYFIEDFNTLEIGQTETYIKQNTGLTQARNLKTSDYFGGVSLVNTGGDGFIQIPLGDLYEGTLYFTINIDSDAGTADSWSGVYFKKGSQIASYFNYRYDTSTNQIVLYFVDQITYAITYAYYDIPTPMTQFNFKVYYNNTTKKMSVWINNELIIENIYNTYSNQTSFDLIFIVNSVNTYVNPLWSTGIDNIAITDSLETPFIPELPEVPYYWLDWCGNDAGKFLETTPTNLCDIGNASAVVFDGAKWSWDCVDGVVSQNCRSYISTTLPVDGVCGTWAGETFDVWPAKTQLCDPSASLIEGTMTETINGWSWGCAGFNGGSNSVCFADKGVGTSPVFPELPSGAIDDCDGLPLLEGLVCKIGNTIKQIFLPSSEKLNELNQTINKIATKFPFSYISIATDTIKEVGVKINETGDFEMSLLGGEKKSIDFNRIPFAEHIKGFTTTLFILFFLFWLVRYIRNVF